MNCTIKVTILITNQSHITELTPEMSANWLSSCARVSFLGSVWTRPSRLAGARSQLRCTRSIVPLARKKKKITDALGILVSTRHPRRCCWIGTCTARLLCSSGAVVLVCWFIAVYPSVPYERLLGCSPILAETAGKRHLPSMLCFHVSLDLSLSGCPILAESAGNRLLSRVCLHMPHEVGPRG
jgi:hypothetical protein